MATYDNYPPPRQQQRPPMRDDRMAGGMPPPPYSNGANNYSQDGYGSDSRRPRQQQRFEGPPPSGPNGLPPPPMGDALGGNNLPPSAMKRDGSRSRVPHLRPEFPDEASYLGSQAPDLEGKNRPRHRQFRDKRDGYESEEGEMHRKSNGRRGPPGDDYDDRRRRPRDRDPYDYGAPPPRRRDTYDDREPPRGKGRNSSYYDDDEPPRRRGGGRPPPEIEYGSDPIPVRRRNTERPSRRGRDPYDDDSEEEDRRPRRHRSQEDRRRGDPRDDRYGGSKRGAKDDYYDDPRDRRRDRSRGGYSDDEYDRRDRGEKKSKIPKEIMVGGKDIGPLVHKGRHHYAMVAPILTPLILNAAKKYLAGSGKK